MQTTSHLLKWDASQMPDQTGKTFVVTGATAGLGWESVQTLAAKNAHVIAAVRNVEKARKLVSQLPAEVGQRIEVRELDLASLTSIENFAKGLNESIHGLLNNAGVMLTPLTHTVDGFELQLGVNHLGHFALTAALWNQLVAANGATIVTISSNAHKSGRINFDDLNSHQKYSSWGAYAQSKLANLVFTYELNRRVQAAGLNIKVTAAHPGYSATDLSSPMMNRFPRFLRPLGRSIESVVAQPAAMGALPGLFALTATEVPTGAYIGPDGWEEWRGFPKVVSPISQARDLETGQQLWDVSLELIGRNWLI
jgi:NAD(P)-dependent dehydrogenase (short-subunit alcohol dehydrogenase family)